MLSFCGLCSKRMLCLHWRSYPTLWDPMDCSPPGSSVHGIFQTRILEWVALSFFRDSSPAPPPPHPRYVPASPAFIGGGQVDSLPLHCPARVVGGGGSNILPLSYCPQPHTSAATLLKVKTIFFFFLASCGLRDLSLQTRD